MGWMPDKSVNPTAMYACYINNVSPTFTAKLVARLTDSAVEENGKMLSKGPSNAKIMFQKATKAAAVLRRLQLAVHHSSIVHEPLSSKSVDGLDNGRSTKSSESSKASGDGLSSKSDGAIIDVSRKSPLTESALAAATATVPAATATKPQKSKDGKKSDEFRLVSPEERANANGEIPIEEESATVSSMQSCVNGLVSYFSMFVDGAVYALYRDEDPAATVPSETGTASTSVASTPTIADQQSAKASGKSAFGVDAAADSVQPSESFRLQKELEAQREKDKEFLKVIPAVPLLGGLFSHVKDNNANQAAAAAASAESSKHGDASTNSSNNNSNNSIDSQKLNSNRISSKDRLAQGGGKDSSSVSVFGQQSVEHESAEVQLNYYLLNSGIRNIIVGHQPRGDAPLILDSEDGVKVCFHYRSSTQMICHVCKSIACGVCSRSSPRTLRMPSTRSGRPRIELP
jgi:hypothetical protein